MNSIFSILSSIPDHRRGNRLTYPLDYLLLIAFTAIMSGFTTWAEFELYAELHKADLKKLYKRLTKKTLQSYTPSHDTFGYVFKTLEPDIFKEAFKNWIMSIFEIAGQHICIDGKTMRGVKSIDPDSESHTVTAYISGIRASLEQVYISKKSNEINAIKDILDLIDIQGCTVTIDAIGTQKDIINKIIKKQGHYILQVKSNQAGTLLELEEHFKPFYKDEIMKIEQTEADHGRVETRAMESIIEPLRFSDIECYKNLNKWSELHSIHKMTRRRFDKKKEEESIEVSYYISSHTDQKKVFEMIREHWAIENNLHYCLDVILSEDQSRRRAGNAAKNVNIIYKIALFFLERLKMKSKRALKAHQMINATKKPSEIIMADYC